MLSTLKGLAGWVPGYFPKVRLAAKMFFKCSTGHLISLPDCRGSMKNADIKGGGTLELVVAIVGVSIGRPTVAEGRYPLAGGGSSYLSLSGKLFPSILWPTSNGDNGVAELWAALEGTGATAQSFMSSAVERIRTR